MNYIRENWNSKYVMSRRNAYYLFYQNPPYAVLNTIVYTVLYTVLYTVQYTIDKKNLKKIPRHPSCWLSWLIHWGTPLMTPVNCTPYCSLHFIVKYMLHTELYNKLYTVLFKLYWTYCNLHLCQNGWLSWLNPSVTETFCPLVYCCWTLIMAAWKIY